MPAYCCSRKHKISKKACINRIKIRVITILSIPTTWSRNAMVEIMTSQHPMYQDAQQ